ncbi:porin family protein [Bdellovibrio sp. SKB1291214]|uniref:outer membrane beta-barrel protein n=1 Tax=Bdellovibrio sp. SKB1291214 TaxID=1732569 RepID=UPI000B741960|nr:outer membrane beta-barrel protein [Bdellovibrio sp. SKB1291214]UYL08076.1 porin family protein [Bdellovibrio sp. SKB1291214]
MKTTGTILHSGLLALVLAAGMLLPSLSHAQSSDQKHYLIAQNDPDEAFDPFSDYSEFDEDSDEEADVNFFRNGRFFTVGLAGGYRGFTGNFADQYSAAPSFGLFLSYFFDLRLALHLGFQTGDHAVKFSTLNAGNVTNYTGNVSMTSINFDLKYYLNTQNVTRGLADLNPYILGGLGQFYRTYTISGIDSYSRDSTMGFDVGAGVEIPLMRKKAYLGLQAAYHYVNFSDESKSYVQGTEKLEKNLSGDLYDFLFILGMNF